MGGWILTTTESPAARGGTRTGPGSGPLAGGSAQNLWIGILTAVFACRPPSASGAPELPIRARSGSPATPVTRQPAWRSQRPTPPPSVRGAARPAPGQGRTVQDTRTSRPTDGLAWHPIAPERHLFASTRIVWDVRVGALSQVPCKERECA